MREAYGKGFAGRLAVSRQLASELDGPAERLEQLGSEYSSLVVDIDPAITIIRIVDESPDRKIPPQVQELFKAIKEMVDAAKQSAISGEGLISSLEEAASLSRDLRRPVRPSNQVSGGFLTGVSSSKNGSD